MNKKTLEQIKKINQLESDMISKTLLDSISLFWELDKIIDKNIERFSSDMYSINKEFRELMLEFGESISGDYLNIHDNSTPKLLRYLGFERNDEIADNIITDY